jgi:uncharacterized RDD family membrane protein YckC
MSHLVAEGNATPALFRRLAAFVYEGVLLFGVLMVSGLFYAALTQKANEQIDAFGWRLFLLIVLASYFCWFWSHGGQTVAMRAWHIRLVTASGGRLSKRRALARFALAWVWFVPALGIARILGVKDGASLSALIALGVLAYAALATRLPDRQFWHDIVCGTRLIHSPPLVAKAAL